MSEDGYVVRVTAELCDVVPHPVERSDLVQQTIVAARAVARFRAQRFMGEESQRPQAIIHRDEHDPVAGQGRSVEDQVVRLACGVRATVKPDHDRCIGRVGSRPDVQVQAVL